MATNPQLEHDTDADSPDFDAALDSPELCAAEIGKIEKELDQELAVALHTDPEFARREAEHAEFLLELERDKVRLAYLENLEKEKKLKLKKDKEAKAAASLIGRMKRKIRKHAANIALAAGLVAVPGALLGALHARAIMTHPVKNREIVKGLKEGVVDVAEKSAAQILEKQLDVARENDGRNSLLTKHELETLKKIAGNETEKIYDFTYQYTDAFDREQEKNVYTPLYAVFNFILEGPTDIYARWEGAPRFSFDTTKLKHDISLEQAKRAAMVVKKRSLSPLFMYDTVNRINGCVGHSLDQYTKKYYQYSKCQITTEDDAT